MAPRKNTAPTPGCQARSAHRRGVGRCQVHPRTGSNSVRKSALRPSRKRRLAAILCRSAALARRDRREGRRSETNRPKGLSGQGRGRSELSRPFREWGHGLPSGCRQGSAGADPTRSGAAPRPVRALKPQTHGALPKRLPRFPGSGRAARRPRWSDREAAACAPALWSGVLGGAPRPEPVRHHPNTDGRPPAPRRCGPGGCAGAGPGLDPTQGLPELKGWPSASRAGDPPRTL